MAQLNIKQQLAVEAYKEGYKAALSEVMDYYSKALKMFPDTYEGLLQVLNSFVIYSERTLEEFEDIIDQAAQEVADEMERFERIATVAVKSKKMTPTEFMDLLENHFNTKEEEE